MRNNIKLLLHKVVTNSQGQIVLIQWPNLSLIVFIIASLAAHLWTKGSFNYLFKGLAFGSIFTWSWLEIFYGINYFRRILGLVVLLFSLLFAVTFLRSFR